MSALAWLQTIVAVRARGSSSCHFGPPLVLRSDGAVEIIEPDGSVVVPAGNVAAYPKPSAGEEVAVAATTPQVVAVASPPAEVQRRDQRGRR